MPTHRGGSRGGTVRDPNSCWFTILAECFLAWGKGGIYDGPPTELRPGEIVFTKIDEPEIHGGDFCTWHYAEETTL